MKRFLKNVNWLWLFILVLSFIAIPLNAITTKLNTIYGVPVMDTRDNAIYDNGIIEFYEVKVEKEHKIVASFRCNFKGELYSLFSTEFRRDIEYNDFMDIPMVVAKHSYFSKEIYKYIERNKEAPSFGSKIGSLGNLGLIFASAHSDSYVMTIDDSYDGMYLAITPMSDKIPYIYLLKDENVVEFLDYLNKAELKLKK